MEEFDVLKEIWCEEHESKMKTVTHPIRKALSYINQNYKEELTREKISASLNISPDYLSRRFHKECGLHLKEYINRARINKSKYKWDAFFAKHGKEREEEYQGSLFKTVSIQQHHASTP